MPDKVSISEKHALFSETWSPKIIGEVDDYDVKLSKLEGEFIWHAHEDADELFLVTKGRLRLDLEGCDSVTLDEGEIFVVPKGVQHLPVAEPYAEVLMLEKKGVVNTGDAGGARTAEAKPL